MQLVQEFCTSQRPPLCLVLSLLQSGKHQSLQTEGICILFFLFYLFCPSDLRKRFSDRFIRRRCCYVLGNNGADPALRFGVWLGPLHGRLHRLHSSVRMHSSWCSILGSLRYATIHQSAAPMLTAGTNAQRIRTY